MQPKAIYKARTRRTRNDHRKIKGIMPLLPCISRLHSGASQRARLAKTRKEGEKMDLIISAIKFIAPCFILAIIGVIIKIAKGK